MASHRLPIPVQQQGQQQQPHTPPTIHQQPPTQLQRDSQTTQGAQSNVPGFFSLFFFFFSF